MSKNSRLIDMSGQRIGRWTVMEQAGNAPRGGALWSCVCDCGKRGSVLGADLRSGKSRSCGCEGSRAKVGQLNATHGDSSSRLYATWQNMHRRCRDLSNANYGGRGISVCAEWADYSNFRGWALNAGYRDDLTIERLDVNSGYQPSNCIWADKQAQSENRRFVAKAPSGQLWWHVAQSNGITQSAYRTRLFEGWDYHQAATWPMGKRRVVRQRDGKGQFV